MKETERPISEMSTYVTGKNEPADEQSIAREAATAIQSADLHAATPCYTKEHLSALPFENIIRRVSAQKDIWIKLHWVQ